VFVAGTAVFSAADRQARIAELRALAEGGRRQLEGTARS